MLVSSATLQVCFVDLRPVLPEASPLSPEGFAVLVGVLLASSHLDARALAEAVDDVDVKTKVRAQRRRVLQRPADQKQALQLAALLLQRGGGRVKPLGSSQLHL